MFFFILFLREKGLQSGANPSKLNITPGMWIMLTLIPERNFMSTGCVMKDLLHGFEEYLKSEKGAAANTLASYLRDVRAFLSDSGMSKKSELKKQTPEHFRRYFLRLAEQGRSAATLQRAKASLVCFYTYLMTIGAAARNPVKSVTLERSKQTLPDILTPEEIERLLEANIHSNQDKVLRDRAMLELLYATGIKAGELIALDLQDVNPSMGYIRCRGVRSDRVLPLYPEAAQRLDHYIRRVRPFHVSDPDEQALFLNSAGTRMTRQGFWKLIKTRAAAAHIDKEITPQILRHSFAMHLLNNGADVAMVQEILGHADISTTQIYTKQFKNDLQSRYGQFHPKMKK